MGIKVESFGQLAEITGKDLLVDAADTDQLHALLRERYQALGRIKYLLAVNRKLVTGNISLDQTDTVALLPPYSGG